MDALNFLLNYRVVSQTKLKKDIYILSGLGADERVFKNLDLSNYNVCFVKWVIPERNESIENYAARLVQQITVNKPILIGLSFGGVMAIEISKLIDFEKVVIISSVKSKKEVPYYYRLAGRIGIHKLLPKGALIHTNFITNWMFGVSSTADKSLLRQIFNDTNSDFLYWAIDKILSWKNEIQIPNLFHIHGTSDRILPAGFIKSKIEIENGGHLMLLNKSVELENVLHEIIK